VIAAKKGYTAHAKFVRMSPRKVRPIANQVRRKPYPEAMSILTAMPHKGAKLLRKVVKSAADNALFQNKQLDEEALYVRHVEINDGPRIKRFLPRGRGRADQLIKPLCHISVAVEEIALASGE
jgi:large subunit ribosomal protein L22